MIHTFKAVGQPMLLDVGSGAVHAIDDMAFDVLEMWNDHTPEEIRDALKEKYTAQELDEVISELKQLEELGALNAPDNYDDVKQVTEPGVVKSMCLHAAHDCNLRCKYCFAATGDFCMGERKLLPYEVGKAAIDWLVAHSGKRVNLELDFFGGEPLMNFPVVKRLVEYGRSIEKEKAVNDRMRKRVDGKGSYDIIMNKAQEFVRRRNACDKEYYVRGTFTGFNKDFGNDVLHLADQGFDQISVEPVVTDPKCEYALREEDLPEIREEYERLAQIYMDRRANGKWFNFFHFMVDLEGGPCLRKRLTGCGAGNEYVAVTPDGDIYPCHQFVGRDGYRMGSVLDGTFDRDIQAKFAHNTVLNKEKCRDCWARFFCSGGCAANAEAFHGDISQPYDMECQMERKRLECAMAIYAKERAARMAKETKE